MGGGLVMRNWTRRQKIIFLAVIACLLLLLWWLLLEGADRAQNVGLDILFAFLVLFFIYVRLALCHIIGKAAERRSSGYGGWVVAAFIVGPLPTWIAYLAFVHWRPVSNLPASNITFKIGQQIGTRLRGIASTAATVVPISATSTLIQNPALLDRIKDELFALECATLKPEEYAEAHAALDERLKRVLLGEETIENPSGPLR